MDNRQGTETHRRLVKFSTTLKASIEDGTAHSAPKLAIGVDKY